MTELEFKKYIQEYYPEENEACKWKDLKYCKTPKSGLEILTLLNLKNHTDNYKKHLLPLIERGFIQYIIKENLKDRNQKYQTTELGKSVLND